MNRVAATLATAGAAALAACTAPKASGAADSAGRTGGTPPAAATSRDSSATAPAPGAVTQPIDRPSPEQPRPSPPSPMSPAQPPAQPPAKSPQPGANAPAPGNVTHPIDRPSPEQRRPASPDVQELWSAQQSGIEQPRRAVARSAAEWQALAAQLPDAPTPSVDYATHMLVLAALGQRPTGGHAVQVTGFERRGNGAVIEVTAYRPGAQCMTTQAITTPAVVARVPRVTGDVEWREKGEVREC